MIQNTKTVLQNIVESSIESLTDELQKLESSLKPIKKNCTLDGEYGVCQECDEEISLERLKLLPESTHCVECLNRLGL